MCSGIELGVWETEGLDVEYHPSEGSQAAAQAVGTGADEVGTARLDAVLPLVQEGAPLVVFGQAINPISGVISLADTNIESWRDLEGKTVGRFPFGSTGPLARAALHAAGGDPDAVEWRNLDPGSQEVLLMERQVDAVVAYWPQSLVQLDHQGFEVNVLKISEILDILNTALITREEIVETRPEMLGKFIRGWLNAHQKWIVDIDEMLDAHQGHVNEFDETIARDTLPYLYSSRISPEIDLAYGKGWTADDRMLETIAALEQIGMLRDRERVQGCYTNAFIEANQALGRETAALYDRTLTEEFEVGPHDA